MILEVIVKMKKIQKINNSAPPKLINLYPHPKLFLPPKMFKNNILLSKKPPNNSKHPTLLN